MKPKEAIEISEEAIEILKYDMAMTTFNPMTGEDIPLWLLSDGEQRLYHAHETAIEALREVRQYREIGTVEECREAVENQNSKEYESNRAEWKTKFMSKFVKKL